MPHPLIKETRVSIREFLDYVEKRGSKAEPIINSIEAAHTGAEIRTVGFTLLGARGRKDVVFKNEDDTVSMERVVLFCDSVDYATAKLQQRKSRKKVAG